MKDSLWSVDLFRCESVLLKSHWVLAEFQAYYNRHRVHSSLVGGGLCHFSGQLVKLPAAN